MQAGRTLLSPDFHIEVRLDLQLNAHIEQCAAQSVEHMRIVGHAQESHMHDTIDGRYLAQLSAPLQNPLLDCIGKSAFNFDSIRHKRLLFKPKVYTVYMSKLLRQARGWSSRTSSAWLWPGQC